MPLQLQPAAAWHHQQQHQQERDRSTSTSVIASLNPMQQLEQLQRLATSSVLTGPAGPAVSQQQHAGALQLHQLPSAALAAVAGHLTSAERLTLGRLVFGSSHATAAAAVLGTLHACNVRSPHACRNTNSLAQQQQACTNEVSCLAAAASMPRLGRLQLELQLPQQQRCAWAATVEGLASMRQLTSLHLQLSSTAQGQQQQQHVVQQQLAALLEAVGHLQHCKELFIRLCPAEADLELCTQHSIAAGLHAKPASLPTPATLLPLVQLSSCLQLLQIKTPQPLPAAALGHLACLSQLTALHLQCNSSSSTSSAASYCEAVAFLLPIMPQLHSLVLAGYFLQPAAQQQQQQQLQEQMSQQGSSSSSSMLPLLHHLQPSKLTWLDLSCSSQCCLPFPAAAQALAGLTSLRNLGLAGTAATADDLTAIGQGLRQLTRLNLGNYMNDADMYGIHILPLQRWLGQFGSLQELLLCQRTLKAEDIQAVVQHLPQLTRLDLSEAFVGVPALIHGLFGRRIQSSGTVAQLLWLSLRGIRLGPEGLHALAAAAVAAAAVPGGLAANSGLGQLQELDLRGCRAGGAAVAALRRAVPGLQVVQLDGMDWAEQGLEWLIGDY
jgi:hypothetical protein